MEQAMGAGAFKAIANRSRARERVLAAPPARITILLGSEDLTLAIFSDAEAIAASQDVAANCPLPRSPERCRGPRRRSGWYKAWTAACPLAHSRPPLMGS